MDLGIECRQALVLGRTRGLGWSTAKALCDNGATVSITGRDGENASKRVTELSAQSKGYALDLSLADGIDAFVDEVKNSMATSTYSC